MIRGSPRLQEAFAQHQVPSLQDGRPVYVIDGLLDLALSTHDARSFDARMAACECLKAYFFNHTEIRTHFLQRAIAGHQAEADETANVLTTLLRAKDEDMASDPYRFWFASVLMIHILSENPQAKQLAMGVVDGDAQSGEEVVTSIQTMSEHLIGGLGVGIENRVTIGYLMLLATWLFEDFDAVNDFLGEGSNLQRLTQAIAKETSNSRIVQGLCALLLGIIYEFSTRDSPVPRPALHKVLMSALGREKYILYLTRLRSEPAMRDFEVLPQRTSRSNQGGLPEIYFDSLFVDFFKDNFRRLLRAIDRDPGEEVGIVMNGVARGISREMVDNLRLNLEEKEKALRDADAKLMLLEQQLDREKAEHRHSKEAMAVELSKMATANEAAQQRSAVEIGYARAAGIRIHRSSSLTLA